MQTTVPLLNPEQIDELNSMITSISRENSKTLEDVLSEEAEISNLTLMQLYNLVVEQWGKKQKIIDNLCHFSLTMMSTVEYLWAQKNQDEDKLTNAEAILQALNKQIHQLAEQNQSFKSRINEAQSQIDIISCQKQTIEELYRTQSCCNFNGTQQPLSKLQQQPFSFKDVKDDIRFEQQQSKLLQEKNKTLAQKQKQIEALNQSKRQLQSKISQLMQQNELAKMEVELAELAIKDALTEKMSASMISNHSADLSHTYREDFYTSRSNPNFLNGELECFSTLQENQRIQNKNSLLNQMMGSAYTEINNSLLNQSHNSSITIAKESPQDITAAQSPFKKKSSIISQNSDFYTLKQSILSNEQSMKQEKDTSLLTRNYKTVLLQCNLIKGLPKLDFNYKECAYEIEFLKKPKGMQVKNVNEKACAKGEVRKEKRKEIVNKEKKILSKSEIVRKQSREQVKLQQELNEKKNDGDVGLVNEKQSSTKKQKSFTNLYGFLKSKLVSQRIKVK